MFCCGLFKSSKTSSVDVSENAKNNMIESQLKNSALHDKLNLKVLLLGSGESGKSTVLKQIKLSHKIGMTPAELAELVRCLRKNAIDCITVLIAQVDSFGLKLNDPVAETHAQVIRNLDPMDFELDTTLSTGIEYLWKNPAVREAYTRRTEYWILEAADYYLDHIDRFADEEFEPTEEDSIMARVMTVGIIKTDIPVPPLTFTVVDVGGQRNERRKWIHAFDNVQSIIFLCNLAGYNTVLFEDANENRMKDTIELFKSLVNNPVFSKTPIYLIFNKKDLFEQKIKKDPITVCEVFADYTGPADDVRPVLTYIEDKFRSEIKSGDPARLSVHNIAARFKRDVKNCWEEIQEDMRQRYKSEINDALKALNQPTL